MLNFLIVCLSIVFFAGPQSALAAPIVFNFDARVSSIYFTTDTVGSYGTVPDPYFASRTPVGYNVPIGQLSLGDEVNGYLKTSRNAYGDLELSCRIGVYECASGYAISSGLLQYELSENASPAIVSFNFSDRTNDRFLAGPLSLTFLEVYAGYGLFDPRYGSFGGDDMFVTFDLTRFEAAIVPLPGTLGLLAASIAGLGFIRRSRAGFTPPFLRPPPLAPLRRHAVAG